MAARAVDKEPKFFENTNQQSDEPKKIVSAGTKIVFDLFSAILKFTPFELSMAKAIDCPPGSGLPENKAQLPLGAMPVPNDDHKTESSSGNDKNLLELSEVPSQNPPDQENDQAGGEGGDSGGNDLEDLEEKSIGIHQRIQIKPTTSQPYRWICHIRIKIGEKWYGNGSGFLVNIPGSTTGCILTAGHNLWLDKRTPRRYAEDLEITFPGKDPIQITKAQFMVPLPFRERLDPDHDYGVIVLPGYQGKGFGYSTIITDTALNAATAMVFGYPNEKPKTMWGSGGALYKVEKMQLQHTLDTSRGQSGSPVYIWYKGYWTVVGIHVAAMPEHTKANRATRLTVEKMREIVGWLKHPLHKAKLELCEGSNRAVLKMVSSTDRGSGQATAQYLRDADEYTDLTFIPLESAPQGLPIDPDKVIYAISSFKLTNTYLRLEGNKLHTSKESDPPRDGTVNCQSSVGPMEMFQITWDNTHGFLCVQSVKYPGVYLRMDPKSVRSSHQEGPPESVNVQWDCTLGDLQRFRVLKMGILDPKDGDDTDNEAKLKQEIETLEQQAASKKAELASIKALKSN
ncbi:hypothetical protein TWF281_002399 [Arthrobotrys megalospora]